MKHFDPTSFPPAEEYAKAMFDLEALVDTEIKKIESKEGVLSQTLKIVSNFLSSNFGESYKQASLALKNKDISPEKLEELSQHTSVRIRKGVAGHPNTSFSTLLEMKNKKENFFLSDLWLMMHHSAPQSYINTIVHTVDSEYLAYLVKKPDISMESLETIAYTRSDAEEEIIASAKDHIKQKITLFSLAEYSSKDLHQIAQNSNSKYELLCVGINNNVVPETFFLVAEKLKEKDLVAYQSLQEHARPDLVKTLVPSTTKSNDTSSLDINDNSTLPSVSQ